MNVRLSCERQLKDWLSAKGAKVGRCESLKVGWLGLFGVLASVAMGATYEVGPGKPLARISQVPWESLTAGDEVLIHWRPDSYKEKWVICVAGTEEKPVVVRGVPGPKGQLPVIDGKDAVTRPSLNFWNEARGVIKIGGSNTPKNVTPSHIVVENLEIRGARAGNAFTGRAGRGTYKKNV